MAYNLGASPYGNDYYGNRGSQNSRRNNRSENSTRLRLRNYQGPYDIGALTQARNELLYYVERMQDTAVWCRIRRKTDVNVYEMRDSADGYGKASTEFSHAGVPENLIEEDSDEEPVNEAPPDFSVKLSKTSISTKSTTPSATVVNQKEKDTVDLTETNEKGGKKNELGAKLSNVNEIDDVIYQPQASYSLAVDGIEVLPAKEDEVIEIDDSSDISGNNSVILIDKQNASKDSNEEDTILIGVEIKDEKETEKVEFRCDFCDEVYKDMSSMQEHLETAEHFAASEYSIDDNGGRKLKKPMVVQNADAKFRTVLTVCPNYSCQKVFANIFACMQHYNVEHCRNSNERNQYGLISVVEEEDCINAVNPKRCQMCKRHTQFNTIKDMCAHFQSNLHYPYTEIKDCQKIFFCSYCQSDFKTFQSIALHLEAEHLDSVKNGFLGFTVFHYSKVEINRLGPFEDIAFTDNEIEINPESGKGSSITNSGTSTGSSSKGTRNTTEGISGECLNIGTSNNILNGNVNDGTSQKTAGTSGSTNTSMVSSQRNNGNSGTLNLNSETRKRKLDTSSEDTGSSKITVTNEYVIKRNETINMNTGASSLGNGNANTEFVNAIDTMDDDDDDADNVSCSKDNLQGVFKCDFCPKTAQHRNQINQHLVESNHLSASTVLTDQQDNIVYLEKRKSVINPKAKFQKIAAVCPVSNCHLLFDDIYMSEHHNASVHRNTDRSYYLADIADRITVKISCTENVCSTCGQAFRKLSQLNSHYSKMNHFPFPERTDCDFYVLCPYCNRNFSSFKVAIAHVKGHEKHAKNNQLELVILYVNKTPQKYTLPPNSKTKKSERSCIQSTIAGLTEMKKQCGKKGKKKVRAEIRALRNLL